MVGYIARTRPGAARLLRGALVVLTAGSLSLPPAAHAAALTVAGPAADLGAFDRGFRAGQEEFDRGDYLVAARTWTRAAALLPESVEHKENRRAIHEYIADAYQKAVERGAAEDVLREGLAALDAYANGFTSAYPQETLPENVAKVRLSFRTQLDELQAKAPPEPPPEPKVVPPAPAPAPAPAPRPEKPWKGLAIGGGVAVGAGAAMLAVFAAGAAKGSAAEAEFDDPANACDLDAPTGECADIASQGKRANILSVTGGVMAPLLIGAGVAMLVIAKRRKSSNAAFAPVLGRGMVGLTWQQRF